MIDLLRIDHIIYTDSVYGIIYVHVPTTCAVNRTALRCRVSNVSRDGFDVTDEDGEFKLLLH